MTLTARLSPQSCTPDGNLHNHKTQTSVVTSKHFLALLRSQAALIRQVLLPEGLAQESCDLSAFGSSSAVIVRKAIPSCSRSSAISESTHRLVSSLQNYLSNTVSAFQLADAICDFCHTVRVSRFMSPSLLQSIIDHEVENGVLLPLTNGLKGLTQNQTHVMVACIDQIRNSNLYRDSVSFCISDIASSKVRRYLHSMQKLVASYKNRNKTGSFQSFIPMSTEILLLLETTTQIISWLHRFLSQVYVPDGYEDMMLPNLCHLAGSVVSASHDLVLPSSAEGSRINLSGFWISVKALIDIMAGEEQFGEEPLQGTHTGRQLLFHHMRKMQSARDKIRKFLD